MCVYHHNVAPLYLHWHHIIHHHPTNNVINRKDDPYLIYITQHIAAHSQLHPRLKVLVEAARMDSHNEGDGTPTSRMDVAAEFVLRMNGLNKDAGTDALVHANLFAYLAVR